MDTARSHAAIAQDENKSESADPSADPSLHTQCGSVAIVGAAGLDDVFGRILKPEAPDWHRNHHAHRSGWVPASPG
jgi:hypothetical protein